MNNTKKNKIREKLNAEKASLREQTKIAQKDLVDLAQGTVSETKQDIKKVLTYGAALVVTYGVSQWALRIQKNRSQKKYIKKISKLENTNTKGKKKVISNPHDSKVPSFGKMLRNEATIFLMGVAKKEILNYLETRKENKKK